ncbi:uncharacterized protein EI90DRAFT_2943036 [Cantharellus anzutake]|uniref:uncharacterized protein n=1 Tax=Cantharellus anzutake TaxID=1750568 RepID=UPI001902EAD6|nr:uncharacterized protein EI90DRAFT_2943036 [Cantharellus anzutake]KAF8317775.1 hypothetical protein EI90DRAFT_2943036 [Cantharellus anzutake]
MSFLHLKRFHASAWTRAARSKAHHHQLIPDDTFPRGYLATGLYAGVKKNKVSTTLEGGPKDLALIVSTSPRTSAAGCFTRNVFKAAPVKVSMEVLKQSAGRANKVVVNSGCANAVTGMKGLEDAWAMVQATDLAAPKPSGSIPQGNSTLVMSTGVIGQSLPISHVLGGIKTASAALEKPSTSRFADWELAAKAFMTTDTFPKLRVRSFNIPSIRDPKESVSVRIAGIDKGAGMIHPNMGPPHATLLGLIVTDAAVNPKSLQSALTYAVSRSFNSISVDGDMSTNDTVLALANGAADPTLNEIDEDLHPAAFRSFRDELTSFAIDLAKLVVYDGEGATKLVTVTVKNAPSYEDAHRVAATVSTSSLVKCALYGEDAKQPLNFLFYHSWGRILCAVGYAPLSTNSSTSPTTLLKPMFIDPTKVSVSFIPSDNSAPLDVLVNGEPEIVDEARAKEVVSADKIAIEIDLHGGNESATYYTCDLSHEYVTINGDYRT